MWARFREEWGGRAPRRPRRRRAGASPRARLQPRVSPPPPHPQDALTSSSSQSLRAWYWNRGRPPAPPPPPRAPGRRRGRLGSEGLGPRAVLLRRPLAAQEAARLRGAGEGPRGVDLPVNPLVQRSHRSPRARSLSLGRFCIGFLPLGPCLLPSGEKGRKKKGRRRRRKGRRQRRLPARHSSRRRATAWLSLLRPLPGGWAEPGSGGVFSFPLLFCFQLSARPRTA